MRRKRSQPNIRDEEAARSKCLRLLATRARSAAELRQSLRRGGFDEDVIAVALADLERAGLINDEEFARSWVASRRQSGGRGRVQLRWELRRKGIPQELIRRFVDEGIDDESEVQQALELAERRLRGKPEPKALYRVQRLLLTRGFEFEVVNSVLKQLSAEGEHQ